MTDTQRFILARTKEVALKISYLLFIVWSVSILGTSASLMDREDSVGNNFAAGSLLTGMRSDQANFGLAAQINPGEVLNRDVYVQKNGTVAMDYQTTVEILPGSDVDLCSALGAEVNFNRYLAAPLFPGDESNLNQTSFYSGIFTNLAVNNSFATAYPYFANLHFGINEHWYKYQVNLPVSAPVSLENKQCNFNLVTKAWQPGEAYGVGFYDQTTLTNSIQTGNWVPSAPTGLTVLDVSGANLSCGGTTNNRNVTFDWADSSMLDFNHYEYQLGSGPVVSVVASQVTLTLPDADGTYQFRVRSVDNAGLASAWTNDCGVILSRPVVPAITPVVINEVYYRVGDRTHLDGGDTVTEQEKYNEWVELYNNTNAPVNLNDWKITYATSGEKQIGNITIPAHGFVVLSNTDLGCSGGGSSKRCGTWEFWTLPGGVVKFDVNAQNPWIDNSGTLRLVNAANVEIDRVSWGGDVAGWTLNAAAGQSIARNPLGVDTNLPGDWVVDVSPDPGTNPHSHIQVKVEQTDHQLLVNFVQAAGFDLVKYAVTYNHLVDGQVVSELVQGEQSKAAAESSLALSPLFLGTCSDQGLVCVAHQDISDVRLSLLYKNGAEILGESTLSVTWQNN